MKIINGDIFSLISFWLLWSESVFPTPRLYLTNNNCESDTDQCQYRAVATSHFRAAAFQSIWQTSSSTQKYYSTFNKIWLPYSSAPIHLWISFHALGRGIHETINHDRLWYIEINLPVSQITQVLYRHSVCKQRNKACLDWFIPNTHFTIPFITYTQLHQPDIFCTRLCTYYGVLHPQLNIIIEMTSCPLPRILNLRKGEISSGEKKLKKEKKKKKKNLRSHKNTAPIHPSCWFTFIKCTWNKMASKQHHQPVWIKYCSLYSIEICWLANDTAA